MSMLARRLVALSLLSVLVGITWAADEPLIAPGDKEPVLRVEADGPTSHVTALAFSADGKTLYAAGWDKVIRVWTLNEKEGRFVPDRAATYRVPVGPGLHGAINAMALSQDKDSVWLAAAGKGVFRESSGFRQVGLVRPAGDMNPKMLEDMGTITVFNTVDGSVRLLKGHKGTVDALAFAPPVDGKTPLLLSIARETDPKTTELRYSARLWDVSTRETLATTLPAELPAVPKEPFSPGLTVWRSQSGMQAAFCLSDGRFRVWNVGADKKSEVSSYEDRELTSAVVRLPGPPETNILRTASYGKGKALFTRWQINDNGDVFGLPPPKPATIDSYPRVLGLLSRNARGNADLAAVVLRLPKNGNEYRLQVADITAGNLGAVRPGTTLWRGVSREPVLATSLRGRFVAVAGSTDNVIRVYSIASLLEGKEATLQTLRSDAESYRHVSFVRNGKDLGLLVNHERRRNPGKAAPKPDKDKGDLVFAVRERRVTDNLDGWNTVAPPASDWQPQYVVEKGRGIIKITKKGDDRVRQVPLPDRQALSDYALLPPGKNNKVPLLALASHEQDQPRLVLYNADTGQEMRHFVGHSDRITAIAFSDDGRLLASTAQDQTICVWSLTTLDTIAGKFGVLPGVTVEKRGDNLEVARDTDKLRKGEIIDGLVEAKKVRPLTTYLEFYRAIYAMKAGTEVTLRIRDAGGKPRNVTLTVAQGADERKPLFSLFVLSGAMVGGRDWIGWHPLGPFDASTPRAERHLGWHFNTGDASKPTRFALAEVHRKEYYRKGLLDKLVDQGRLFPEKPIEFLAPRIYVRLAEGDRPLTALEEREVVVRHPRVRLRMNVGDRPLKSLAKLTWKEDDGPEKELNLAVPDEKSFIVSPLKLERGKPRNVVFTAWTDEILSRPFPRAVTLRFEPNSPLIKYKGKVEVKVGETTKRETFVLRAEVFPAFDGEDVQLTIRHRHGGKTLFEKQNTHSIKWGEKRDIVQAFKLGEGLNSIEVIAVNKGALPGTTERETALLNVEVHRTPKDPPPTITFNELTFPGTGGKEERIAIDSPAPVVVHVPAVHLTGEIGAEKNLLLAEWYKTGEKGRPLAKFKREKKVNIDEEVKLTPGLQTFHFRAATEDSVMANRSLTIDFRPPVPRVALVAPREGEVVEGKTPTTVLAVLGRITVLDARFPSRIVLLIDGKEQAEPVLVNAAAGTFSVQATLRPGPQRISIKTSNKWGMSFVSEERLVRYVRPPVIESLKEEKIAGKPSLNFVARVRSLIPLLTSVRVTVNGRDSSPEKIEIVSDKAPGNMHSVTLTGVAIDGDHEVNEISVSVRNAEAESKKPLSLRVRVTDRIPVPEIVVDERGDGWVEYNPRVTISFRVRSKSPLTAVRLIREGRRPLMTDVKLDGVLPDKDKWYHLKETMPLEEGQNYLHVEATSRSREKLTPTIVVSFTPPPPDVELDRLVERGVEGPGFRAIRRAPTAWGVGEVKQGLVTLHGRIRWANKIIARKQQYDALRVFVNGFQQIHGNLKTSGTDPLEREFEVDLLLNRDKQNQVQVVVSGQKVDLVVDKCKAPITEQRLHLLVLSPQGKDEKKVEDEVVRAIVKDRDGKARPTAFEGGTETQVLVGADVNLGYINNRLFTIREQIEELQIKEKTSDRARNDVLMIYYQGDEIIKEDGNFFRMPSAAKDADEADIPCDEILKVLSDTCGANVLLLDVERDRKIIKAREVAFLKDKIADWQRFYIRDYHFHIVMMRHVWMEKAPIADTDRLIAVLREAIPKAGRLRGVVVQMQAIMVRKRLTLEKWVPEQLEELKVGSLP